MNPLITISIPVYNVEKYIEKALSSALNQTYDNLEFLIIDDKGTDNSMAVIRNLIAAHPRGNAVKIIDHDKNQGTGATKNSAIDNAAGEYLFFMDSDDYIAENCIELLFNALKKYDSQMSVGSYTNFDDERGSYSPKIMGDNYYSGAYALTMFENYTPTWNKLYEIKLLRDNKVRCIPQDTFEDIFWEFQLIDIVEKVAVISDITYYYRLDNANSVTQMQERKVFSKKDFAQRYRIQKYMYECFANQKININKATMGYFMGGYNYLIRYVLEAKNLNHEEKKEYLRYIDENPIVTNKKIFRSKLIYIPYVYFPTNIAFKFFDFARNCKNLLKKIKSFIIE